VAGDRAEWDAVIDRLLGLVRPGGAAFVVNMRDCGRYAILGRWFPVARVTEADYPAAFARNGFDPATVEVEAVPVPDWADEGFDAVVIARARKR
jgi:hypothetical protein